MTFTLVGHEGSVRDAGTPLAWADSNSHEHLEISLEARLDAPIISHGSIHQEEVSMGSSVSAHHSDEVASTLIDCVSLLQWWLCAKT